MKKVNHQNHLLHKIQQIEVDHRTPTLSQGNKPRVGIETLPVVMSLEIQAETLAVVLLIQIQVEADLVVMILNTRL